MSDWFVGGLSTAAGQVVGQPSGRVGKLLKLKGYSFQVGTSQASTLAVTLLRGDSSGGTLSSTPIGSVALSYSVDVDGLELKAGYFAIASPTTNANGVTATMWGEYA